jgi:PIN domain nuclease of toxin-antitoxin system
MIYLDTHVVVWLYAKELVRFTRKGRSRLEAEEAHVSPIVRLELGSLREIGKITVEPSRILDSLARSLGLSECRISFADVVAESLDLAWTRDPFDRLIVAQSLAGGGDLLTKDRNLLKHVSQAFW